MRGFQPSRVPGTVVAILFEVSAFGLLASRPGAFTGSLGTWGFTLALYAVLPGLTLVLAWTVGRHWVFRILALKLLVLFWATTPEPAFLPVRWLASAALLAQAGAFLPVRWALVLAGAVGVELVFVGVLLPGMTTDPPDLPVTLAAVVCLAVPAVLLGLLRSAEARAGALAGRNDQLHASVLQLTSANTVFLEQAATAGDESAALERQRITRDLHDVVGQTLTNIIMMMDASLHRKEHSPEETVKLLKWIRKQAQAGLEETRGVLYELRSCQPSSPGGLQALKQLVDTFARLSRIKTKVSWGNLPWRWDPDQERAIYHLVQGSLSNAFRHGAATKIDIHFQVDRGLLGIMVRDNGRGGSDTALGLGQRGMEERLARWGGTVSFKNETFGYVVTASVPLMEPLHKEAGLGPDEAR